MRLISALASLFLLFNLNVVLFGADNNSLITNNNRRDIEQCKNDVTNLINLAQNKEPVHTEIKDFSTFLEHFKLNIARQKENPEFVKQLQQPTHRNFMLTQLINLEKIKTHAKENKEKIHREHIKPYFNVAAVGSGVAAAAYGWHALKNPTAWKDSHIFQKIGCFIGICDGLALAGCLSALIGTSCLYPLYRGIRWVYGETSRDNVCKTMEGDIRICAATTVSLAAVLKFEKFVTPFGATVAYFSLIYGSAIYCNEKYKFGKLTQRLQFIDDAVISLFMKPVVADQNSCSICQEDFLPKEKQAAINCGHIFHNHCLIKWLQIHAIEHENEIVGYNRPDSCPMCREKVVIIKMENGYTPFTRSDIQ